MNSRTLIRVGIVGMGHWASYAHLPALKLLPQYRITALATRRQETADKLALEHDIPHAFGDFRDLVKHPEVDLVIVLTIAPQHEEVVRAAIAAGKDVYCEWPLTPRTEDSISLLEAARAAQVRHVVGLQRRMAPSNRYLRDLLAQGYVGRLRSVRLSVSEPGYSQHRSQSIAFTIPSENFTHVAATFGVHFLDALFTVVGQPREFSAFLINQFKQVTIVETGEVIDTDAPNELLLAGTLAGDVALSIHVEGGKRSGYGVQLEISGTGGDLRVSNAAAFHNQEDNRIEGNQKEGRPLQHLPVPESYAWLPTSDLPSSAAELGDLYAAYASDVMKGTSLAPTFEDAVKLHQLLDLIERSSSTGERIVI